jgi:hypothetical protein
MSRAQFERFAPQRSARLPERVDSTPNRQAVSFEELPYSNMLTLNALIKLLDEKGLVAKKSRWGLYSCGLSWQNVVLANVTKSY